MDIFAHALWTAAATMGVNRKAGTRIRPAAAAWWGVFPDLFAFTVPVGLMVVGRATGKAPDAPLDLASRLYHISHSLIVFAAVFGLVWLAARRPVLALLGWPLHILIDLPTHTAAFFPTPFLWPLSSLTVSGISWANRWFMLANYTALAVVYLLIWRGRQAKAPAPPTPSPQTLP